MNSELSSLISSYDFIKQLDSSKETVAKFESLIESAKLFDQFSRQYSFENLNINGFTLFVRISNEFAKKVVKQIEDKDDFDRKFLSFFDLLFISRDWISDILNVLRNEGNKSLLVSEISISSKHFFKCVHANSNLFLASKHTAFWLHDDFAKFLKCFHLWLAVTNKFPSSLVSLFSQRAAGEHCLSHFRNATIKSPFDAWHSSENWFCHKIFDYINRHLPVKSAELQIERQTRFRLTYGGEILDFQKITNEQKDAYLRDEEQQARSNAPGMRHRNHETVRCRYMFSSGGGVKEKKVLVNDDDFKDLNHSNMRKKRFEYVKMRNNSKPLLLYVHGGGFLANGSVSTEIFLKDIVDKLNGIPVLSIDYSLTVPFPVPTQEVLDVYLWLFSGRKNVKDLLGFHPTEICLMGDSAGSYLAITLIILINELNKQLDEHEKVPRPISLIAAYPVFSLCNMSASKTLLAFEPIIEIHCFLLLFSVFGANLSTVGDFKRVENTKRYQQLASANEMLDDEPFSTFDNIKDSSAWYQCNDYKTYKTRADYISSFYDNSLITPALYAPYFEELKDVQLYVLGPLSDITLDDSVELAKKWKGNVCIDIFPGMMHGFLHFKLLNAETKRVGDLVINRLREAFGLF